MDSEARFGFYGSNYIGEGNFSLNTYIEKHLYHISDVPGTTGDLLTCLDSP